MRWDDPAFGIEWPAADERHHLRPRSGVAAITAPGYAAQASRPACLEPLGGSANHGVAAGPSAGPRRAASSAPSLRFSTQSSARSSSRRGDGAAGGAVEAAAAELRLAVGAQVGAAAIALEHVDHLQTGLDRLGERLGRIRSRPSAEVW